MKYTLTSALTLPFIFIAVSSLSMPVWSQSQDGAALRACTLVATDVDEDGFGWEYNFETGAFGSCMVTADSYIPSPIINEQTGETVQLVRAYWNANRDIAERNIECVRYNFDDSTGQYRAWIGDNFRSNLRHNALPLSPPHMAFVEFDIPPYQVPPDQSIQKHWTVIDGRYIGPLTASRNSIFRTAYVEFIESTEGQAGIRVWGADPTYRDCFDTSGAALRPTGYPEEVLASAEPEERSLIVKGSPTPDYVEPPVNLETGEIVQLTEAAWDVYDNFWERSITCISFQWDGERYEQFVHTIVHANFHAVDIGSQSGLIQYFIGQGAGAFGTEWTVVDGRIQFNSSRFIIYDRVEVLDNSVRSWESSERYVKCSDSGGLVGPYSNPLDERGLIPLSSVLDVTPAVDATPTEPVVESDESSVDSNSSTTSNSSDTLSVESGSTTGVGNSDTSSADDDTSTTADSNETSTVDTSTTTGDNDFPATETSSGGGAFGFGFLYLLLISISTTAISRRK